MKVQQIIKHPDGTEEIINQSNNIESIVIKPRMITMTPKNEENHVITVAVPPLSNDYEASIEITED